MFDGWGSKVESDDLEPAHKERPNPILTRAVEEIDGTVTTKSLSFPR